MFTFVSGNRALDFAGTVQNRIVGATDLVTTPAQLAQWCAAAGFLDEPPSCDAAALDRALRLREAIYRAALSATLARPADPTDRVLINEAARGAPPIVELIDTAVESGYAATGSATAAAVLRTGTVDAVLAALARICVEMLGGPQWARIKECERAGCTRLYLDTSRAGSRRWCDMTICGNRVKSSAFRSRQARN